MKSLYKKAGTKYSTVADPTKPFHPVTNPDGYFPQATKADSLALYNNAFLKDGFYKDNPDYVEVEPDMTASDFRDNSFRDRIIRAVMSPSLPVKVNPVVSQNLIDKMKTRATTAGKPLSGTEETAMQNKLGETRFGLVPGTNLYQFGDIISQKINDIYNPLAPPIYLHPHIKPQGSQMYTSDRFGDISEVPYYDPIAIAPLSILNDEQLRQRIKKYGKNSVTKSIYTRLNKNQVNKNQDIKPIPTLDSNVYLTSEQPTHKAQFVKNEYNPVKGKNLYIQFKDPKQSTRTSQELIHFGDWETYSEFNDALQNAGKMFKSSSANQAKTQGSASYIGTTKEEAMEIYKKYTTPKMDYRTGGVFKDPPVNPIPSGVNVFATSNSIYKTPNNTTVNKPVEYNPVYKNLAEKNFTQQELAAINNKKPDVLKQDRSIPKPTQLTPFEQKVLEKEMEAQTFGQQRVTYNQFGEPVLKWDPSMPKATGRIEPDYMDPITMAAATTAGGVGLGAYGLSQAPKMFLGNLASEATMGLTDIGRNMLLKTKLSSGNIPKTYKELSNTGFRNDPNYHFQRFMDKKAEISQAINSTEGRKRIQGYIDRNPHLQKLNLTVDDVITDFKKTKFETDRFYSRSVDDKGNIQYYDWYEKQIEDAINSGQIDEKFRYNNISSNTDYIVDKNNNYFRLKVDPNSGYNWYVYGYDRPSVVSIGQNYTPYDAMHIIEHEFAHLFQKSDEIKGVDDILGNISLKSDKDLAAKNFRSIFNRYNPFGKKDAGYSVTGNLYGTGVNNKNRFVGLKNQLDYWRYGSGRGKEKAAFAAEVRENLLQRGILKNRYDEITPEMLKDHYILYHKTSGDKYNLRLYDIMKNDRANFMFLSRALNNMPSLVSGLGTGYLGYKGLQGAGVLQEKEKQPEYYKGGLIKRADGSYSKRGLWDNIRANRGSGKEPTKQMLEQERKIKANQYRNGGYLYLDNSKSYADKFNTKLNDAELQGFNYHSNLFKSLLNNTLDYDTKGFYQEVYNKYNGNLDAITKALTPGSPTEHIGTDRYKKPNHPTFSNQSKYAIPIIRQGGKWGHNEEENYDYFKANKRNIRNMINSDGTPLDYFKRAEDYNQDGIPDVKLIYKGKPVFADGGPFKDLNKTRISSSLFGNKYYNQDSPNFGVNASLFKYKDIGDRYNTLNYGPEVFLNADPINRRGNIGLGVNLEGFNSQGVNADLKAGLMSRYDNNKIKFNPYAYGEIGPYYKKRVGKGINRGEQTINPYVFLGTDFYKGPIENSTAGIGLNYNRTFNKKKNTPSIYGDAQFSLDREGGNFSSSPSRYTGYVSAKLGVSGLFSSKYKKPINKKTDTPTDRTYMRRNKEYNYDIKKDYYKR